jgi:hypothetical protein
VTDGNAIKVNFTVAATPTLIAPTNIFIKGYNNTNTIADVRWDSVVGATKYDLRVDDQANPWTAATTQSCDNPNIGDVCRGDVIQPEYSLSVIAGHTYKVWVHANNGTLQSPTSTVFTFSVPAEAVISPTTTTSSPTPIVFTPTPTPAASNALIAVTFRQHGIGLAADNANPNPTPNVISGTIQPIPTPMVPFQRRSATLYLSTGTTVNNGVIVYEYQKNGEVVYVNDNTLGYQGIFDLGAAIPAGQYIVAIRTNNSLSQQANGFASVIPGRTTTVSFPALVSGNVYDSKNEEQNNEEVRNEADQ